MTMCFTFYFFMNGWNLRSSVSLLQNNFFKSGAHWKCYRYAGLDFDIFRICAFYFDAHRLENYVMLASVDFFLSLGSHTAFLIFFALAIEIIFKSLFINRIGTFKNIYRQKCHAICRVDHDALREITWFSSVLSVMNGLAYLHEINFLASSPPTTAIRR